MVYRSTRNPSGRLQRALTRRSRARFALLGLVVGLSVAFPVPAGALAAAAPPTLSGESFSASPAVDNAPYPFFLVCGNGDTSGPYFSFDGTASGPYPGTFTESGTIDYDPTVFNDEYSFGEGPVTGFSTNFAILSPNGDVTGSETLIPTGAPAACWESAGGGGVVIGSCNPFIGPSTPCPIKTEYTVTIVTSTGTYRDHGTSSATLDQSFGLGQYWSADLADAFQSAPSTLTLTNPQATVNGTAVTVSVDCSPKIVNVTLEQDGVKIAPDTSPVNGVASWTVTLPPGTHTLSVEGWNSPSGQPGQHSAVLATTVVIGSSPPPPPPPPPPPSPSTPPATTVSPASSPGVATSPVAVLNVAEIKARRLDHLVPSAAKLAGLLKNGR